MKTVKNVDTERTAYKTEKNKISGVSKIISSGDRVSNIKVLNPDQKYEPLVLDKEYTVAVNSFLASGGDNYVILKNKKKLSTYITQRSIIKERLSRISQISPEKESRIRYK